MHDNTINFFFIYGMTLKVVVVQKSWSSLKMARNQGISCHPFVSQFVVSIFLCYMIYDFGILKLSRILMISKIIKFFFLMFILWLNWTSTLKFGILFVLWCSCWRFTCYFFYNLELSICMVFVFLLNAFSLDC